MILVKIINFILFVTIIIYGCMLTHQRYKARLDYMKLESLQMEASEYNQNYTRLRLEIGTYSSNLVLQDFAFKKLGLVTPDAKHIIGVK